MTRAPPFEYKLRGLLAPLCDTSILAHERHLVRSERLERMRVTHYRRGKKALFKDRKVRRVRQRVTDCEPQQGNYCKYLS